MASHVKRQKPKRKTRAGQNKGKRNTTDQKTRALKTALEALHAQVKNAESYYRHIHWLQERFPNAAYEDVTGLCKLATPEEVREQDYSLNPGRYVGVVIEEDGKTEEEFISEIVEFHDQYASLTIESDLLASIIHKNVMNIAGE